MIEPQCHHDWDSATPKRYWGWKKKMYKRWWAQVQRAMEAERRPDFKIPTLIIPDDKADGFGEDRFMEDFKGFKYVKVW